jgi:hypothetical protein
MSRAPAARAKAAVHVVEAITRKAGTGAAADFPWAKAGFVRRHRRLSATTLPITTLLALRNLCGRSCRAGRAVDAPRADIRSGYGEEVEMVEFMG